MTRGFTVADISRTVSCIKIDGAQTKAVFMDDTLLTATDASRILNRSAVAVRGYEKDGKLPAVRTASGVRLFKKSDVEAFAARLQSKLRKR